jgi:GrpB-like predicted nucleotidyltransferase (UPF0157 family)
METLDDRVRRVVQEEVTIVPYDPQWPTMFRQEKEQLFSSLPGEFIRRVEHFGSTAVPGLAAKPIVDMLAEVTDLEETRNRIVPILEAQGYEYFWRPSRGDDTPPFYAWFIKRNRVGERTHHVHMVEDDFELWDSLLFRDYLIAHPLVADEYQALKIHLAITYPNDRVAYTEGKTAFIVSVTENAKEFYRETQPEAERSA